MQKSDRKRLEEKLAGLDASEKRKLYKLAAKKRKAAMLRSKDRRSQRSLTKNYQRDRDETGDVVFEKRAASGPLSLDEWVLVLLEKQEKQQEEIPHTPVGELMTGTVISVQAGSCHILYEHREIESLLRPELAMAQRSDLAVGDTVDFSQAEDGTYIVEQVRDRRGVLSRPDPHDSRLERVIAANIDLAVIVSSTREPPLNTNLIDRFLLAIQRGDVKPVICVNKIDLLKSDAELDDIKKGLEPYAKLGIDTLFCCAITGKGIDALIEYLSGKLSVFVGHSGVGKTSLLNAINPELHLPTGDVRRKNRKGRHTTVRSTLYELTEGVKIIDTPGVRGFGLWKMDAEELRWYFDEFDDYADACKFSNCTHIHEPACAVRAAVEDGKILPARYESYCRILDSITE